MNVVSGLTLDEPACDAAVALALISSIKDIPVPFDLAAVGELGLAGEVRAVSALERRVKEAARLGFGQIVLPKSSSSGIEAAGIKLIRVGSVYEMLSIFTSPSVQQNKR